MDLWVLLGDGADAGTNGAGCAEVAEGASFEEALAAIGDYRHGSIAYRQIIYTPGVGIDSIIEAVTKRNDDQWGDSQTNYRGTLSVTASGATCQHWTSQEPHAHDHTPANFAGSGLGDHNYCRNPDSSPDGAWCYTTDPGTEREACDLGQDVLSPDSYRDILVRGSHADHPSFIL